MPINPEEGVIRYYTRGSLKQGVRDAVVAMGKDPDRLRIEDLAPFDELHSGGHEVTVALADGLSLRRDQHILDVGCGLGGPARYIASRFGCRVTGIDLTPEHIEVAQELTQRVGLTNRVTFHVGSALHLPFPSNRLDGAIMLHVGMNIADKARLFQSVARVLKQEAMFAIYDIMRTASGTIPFPMPWAIDPATSFVEKPDAYRELAQAAGFVIVEERNLREFVIAYNQKMRAAHPEGSPMPAIYRALRGPDFAQRVANLEASMGVADLSPVLLMCRSSP